MNRRQWSPVILASMLIVAGCAEDGPPERAAGLSASNGVAAPGDVLQPGETVEFYADEFSFAPAGLVAEPGEYRGVLINEGAIEHDIQFGDGDRFVAAAGETVEFDFVVPEGGIAYTCTIAGHEDAGTP